MFVRFNSVLLFAVMAKLISGYTLQIATTIASNTSKNKTGQDFTTIELKLTKVCHYSAPSTRWTAVGFTAINCEPFAAKALTCWR